MHPRTTYCRACDRFYTSEVFCAVKHGPDEPACASEPCFFHAAEEEDGHPMAQQDDLDPESGPERQPHSHAPQVRLAPEVVAARAQAPLPSPPRTRHLTRKGDRR
jgi:hypothetical protein